MPEVAPPQPLPRVNPSVALYFSCDIAAARGSLAFGWILVTADDGPQANTSLLNLTAPVLAVPAGMLEPGRSYTVQLGVSGNGVASTSPPLRLDVLLLPAGGSLALQTPPQGAAELSSPVTLRTSGWTDGNAGWGALAYAFAYLLTPNSEPITLCDFTSNTSLVTLLPAGDLTLIVVARDGFGVLSLPVVATLSVEMISSADPAGLAAAAADLVGNASAGVAAGSAVAAAATVQALATVVSRLGGATPPPSVPLDAALVGLLHSLGVALAGSQGAPPSAAAAGAAASAASALLSALQRPSIPVANSTLSVLALAASAEHPLSAAGAQALADGLSSVAASASNSSQPLHLLFPSFASAVDGLTTNLARGVLPPFPAGGPAATVSSAALQITVSFDSLHPWSRLFHDSFGAVGAGASFAPLPARAFESAIAAAAAGGAGISSVLTEFRSLSYDPTPDALPASLSNESGMSRLAFTLPGLIYSSAPPSAVAVANLSVPILFNLTARAPPPSGARAACAFLDVASGSYATRGCAALPSPLPPGHSASFNASMHLSGDEEVSMLWSLTGSLMGDCKLSFLDCRPQAPPGALTRLFLNPDNVTDGPLVQCADGDGDTPLLRVYWGANCLLWQPKALGCAWDAAAQAFTGGDCVAAGDATQCACRHLTDFVAAAARTHDGSSGLLERPPRAALSSLLAALAALLGALFAAMHAGAAAGWARQRRAEARLLARLRTASLGFRHLPNGGWCWTFVQEAPGAGWEEGGKGEPPLGSLLRFSRLLGLPMVRLRAAIPEELIPGDAAAAAGGSAGLSARAFLAGAPADAVQSPKLAHSGHWPEQLLPRPIAPGKSGARPLSPARGPPPGSAWPAAYFAQKGPPPKGPQPSSLWPASYFVHPPRGGERGRGAARSASAGRAAPRGGGEAWKRGGSAGRAGTPRRRGAAPPLAPPRSAFSDKTPEAHALGPSDDAWPRFMFLRRAAAAGPSPPSSDGGWGAPASLPPVKTGGLGGRGGAAADGSGSAALDNAEARRLHPFLDASPPVSPRSPLGEAGKGRKEEEDWGFAGEEAPLATVASTALAFAFISSRHLLSAAEAAEQEARAREALCGSDGAGGALFDLLLSKFSAMLQPDNLPRAAGWLPAARLWRCALLANADGWWEPSLGLAFALQSVSFRPRHDSLAARLARAARALVGRDVPAAERLQSPAPTRLEGLLALASPPTRREGLLAQATPPPTRWQALAAQISGPSGADPAVLDCGPRAPAELLGSAAEEDHPAERIDCPLTFSAAAIARSMPAALLDATLYRPEAGVVGNDPGPRAARVWATALACATLEELPVCWVVAGEEGEAASLLDRASDWLEAAVARPGALECVMAAARAQCAQWAEVQRQRTALLRSAAARHPLARRLRWDRVGGAAALAAAAARRVRLGALSLLLSPGQEGSGGAAATQPAGLRRWQAFATLLTCLLTTLAVSLWRLADAGGACCAHVRAALSCPADPSLPCRGLVGDCGTLQPLFAASPLLPPGYTCPDWPGAGGPGDGAALLRVAAVAAIATLPVTLLLDAVFRAANGAETDQGAWLRWGWVARATLAGGARRWRLAAGTGAAARRALCGDAAHRPLAAAWSAAARILAPAVAWAAPAAARAKSLGAATPRAAEEAAGATLRARVRAALSLLILYAVWIFLCVQAGTSAAVAARLLPPGAAQPAALRAWGVAIGLHQAALLALPLAQALASAAHACLAEPLWLAGGGRWLEEHADAMSVRAATRPAPTLRERLDAQVAYRAGMT